MPKRSEPTRFNALMREARRDGSVSRVVVSILRAESKAAQALERALARVDLSLPQFNVLMVLAATPGGALPLYEVNQQLVTSPPNMSWISNRMEELALVRKSRHEDDRRVVLLEITEKGWRALGDAAPLVFETEQELLRGFSRSELKSFGDLLARFLD